MFAFQDFFFYFIEVSRIKTFDLTRFVRLKTFSAIDYTANFSKVYH